MGRRLGVLLRRERALWALGIERVAGVDEAGVGPLAGPVVAAAVVFPPGVGIPGVDDSKKLSPERREALAEAIRVAAAGWSVLQSLLGRVGEKQRLPEAERQRQPGQKNTGPGKNHAAW